MVNAVFFFGFRLAFVLLVNSAIVLTDFLLLLVKAVPPDNQKNCRDYQREPCPFAYPLLARCVSD